MAKSVAISGGEAAQSWQRRHGVAGVAADEKRCVSKAAKSKRNEISAWRRSNGISNLAALGESGGSAAKISKSGYQSARQKSVTW